MNTTYFTFGSSSTFPYQNGWVEITAKNQKEACEYFRKLYPHPKHPECLNCAFVYSEQEFQNTSMFRDQDNLGAACHQKFNAEKNGITKMDIYNLVIETTRRCNMACAHCLRGDSENKDMDFDTLLPFLQHVSSISTITFSGGEPTLNVPIMEQTLSYVKEHDIPVYGFYIVTNGKIIPDEFLTTVIKWYAYCTVCGADEYSCGISLSKDNFHTEIPYENESILKGFSFYRDDKTTNFKKTPLIPRGNALYLDTREFKTRIHEDEENIRIDDFDETTDTYQLSDATVYISVNGDILADCDYSYEEMENIAVGNTCNMPAFFNYLQEQYKENS